MTDAAKIQLYFDKEYKIRVLDPVKFEKNEQLEKECNNFAEKVKSFNDKILSLSTILEEHAKKIDSQKLKAIGLRMAVENELENRQRQERALQTMINEKKAELDRYNVQLKSLEKIEQEQLTTLEKLSNAN